MIPEDLRTLSMLDWLENDLLLDIKTLEPASGDASFRRYFRVFTAEQNFIVMDAPPERENVAAFIKIANFLSQADVSVPTVFRQNLADGFLLLEDFGSTSYLQKLSLETAPALYQSALASLLKLQTNVFLRNTDLPRYDHALLTRELDIFEEWFLGELLDTTITPELWQPVKTLLIESALSQPAVFVHRDYHSRNLMVLETNSPGILDFQDAVIGPITYDAVSLLRDCYIAWPQPQIDAWLSGYYQNLTQAGLVTASLETFRRWFDLMGLQRHLKAIGIFARLDIRDQKPNYLNAIPRTLNYAVSVAAAYPELKAFGDFLEHIALPDDLS